MFSKLSLFTLLEIGKESLVFSVISNGVIVSLHSFSQPKQSRRYAVSLYLLPTPYYLLFFLRSLRSEHV